MDRSYYFSVHSSEVLKSWANRLKFFRYIRAQKSQTTLYQEADGLECRFSYNGVEELLEFFKCIGITPIVYGAEENQSELKEGEVNPPIKYHKFKDMIPGTKWIRQPMAVNLQGVPAHIWCEKDYIIVNGKAHNDWTISEADISNAEKMEAVFISCELNVIDPPVDNDACFSPKYFPEYFF
jgi:hypothetical protein